jgi:ornithine cyclodeaminase/alanine dehydrogenase-like protein (mu-crystallin family)
MIFLTNEHIEQVLDMKTCIAAMEDAYRELNEHRAGYRPRIDFYVPREPHYYRWGTMEGASRKLGVFAIRMKSDMLAWENQDGFMVEDKYCIERGRYCGLIFLLSTGNAEPLALMNDGYLQHMRVGACAGRDKILARQDSTVLAMIGSGGMARTYAEAIKQVRPIEVMRVFSPTKANREAFAAEMTEKLDIEVIAFDSPEKALKGADIVSLTTDSLVPVIKAELLEPGMHINNVRNNEAGPDILARADVRARLGTDPARGSQRTDVVTGSDGMFGFIAGNPDEKSKIPASPHHEIDNPNIGTVPDIMAGRWAGRSNDQQITFLNNQGTQGLQLQRSEAWFTTWPRPRASATRCRWNGSRRISETEKIGVMEYWSIGKRWIPPYPAFQYPTTPTLQRRRSQTHKGDLHVHPTLHRLSCRRSG